MTDGSPRHPAAATPPAAATSSFTSSGLRVPRSVSVALRTAGRELWLSWRFVRNDPWAGLYPGIVFALASAVHHGLPPDRLALTALAATAYFWLYLYSFCLTNQLAGQHEDRLNKPFRPLVTHQATPRGTVLRAVIAFTAFPLLGWALGVTMWALVWMALTLLHNLGGARLWLVKNTLISLGVILMLGPAWQMSGPLTPDIWRWMLALSLSIFFLIPVQDLRDLHGDLTAGRATFPLVFGERRTRRFLSAGFLLLPVLTHFLLIRASGAHWQAWVAEAVTAALALTVARRVLRGPTRAYDHRTYRYYEYWYLAVLAAAFIAL